MSKKFSTVEEQQCWVAFEYDGASYDLTHLDVHSVNYAFEDGTNYNFIVTYSCHVFAKEDPSLSTQEHEDLMYHAARESRPFNFKRYELSKQLRNIIENLHHSFCFHSGGRGSYATIKITTHDGEEVDYMVPFKAFREKKKFRLHVTSAYPLDEEHKGGKRLKVNFKTLAKNLTKHKITEPQK